MGGSAGLGCAQPSIPARQHSPVAQPSSPAQQPSTAATPSCPAQTPPPRQKKIEGVVKLRTLPISEKIYIIIYSKYYIMYIYFL